MLVSHTDRFFFVHVPKTGGSSIAHALRSLSDAPDARLVKRLVRIGIPMNRLPVRWRHGGKHSTALELKELFSAPVFDRYFTFAFVRNPWDLMVSYYHFLLATPEHRRSAEVQQLEGFREYLRYEIRRGVINQSRHVCDESGNVIVDHVGRFESLVADFTHICSCLGVRVAEGLKHLNSSDRADYRFYYDDETSEWVARAWADDIRRFGYAFGQPGL